MPPLKHLETEVLKEAFDTGQGPGYVLDFSNRTFKLYMAEELGLDLEQPKYSVNGDSKFKRLHAFLTLADGKGAARVLSSLWDHRAAILSMRGQDEKPGLAKRYAVVVDGVRGNVPAPAATPPNGAGRKSTETGAAKAPAMPGGLTSLSQERLRNSFQSLLSLQPHARGFSFEKFLGELFEAYALAPRRSFRLVGEQIDGSMTLGNDVFLIEAKWQNGKTGVADLLNFSGKVAGKSTWCRGVFFSYTGFSEDGLDAFLRGRATNIICVDGLDLHEILTRPLDLREVINLKLRRAGETSRAFVGIGELLP